MTPPETLLDQEVRVEYGQLHLVSDEGDDIPTPAEAFESQVNGICGTATRGSLMLSTGLRRGPVGLKIELFESEPDADEAWQDVVEATFEATSSHVAVRTWHGDFYPIRLAQETYRVRCIAQDMDAAEAAEASASRIDYYWLQFWLGSPSEDRIVREFSEAAMRRHAERQRLRAAARSTVDVPVLNTARKSL